MTDPEFRPLADGEEGRIYTWESLTDRQRSILAQNFPEEVQRRLAAGETFSDADVNRLVEQTYDLKTVVVLYVAKPDGSELKYMRSILKESVPAARKALAETLKNDEVLTWSDGKVLTMGMRPPNGFRWVMGFRSDGHPTAGR